MSRETPKTMSGDLKVQASKSLTKKIQKELEDDSEELSIEELQSLGLIRKRKNDRAK